MVEPSFTYSLFMNLNQCPAALVTHAQDWAESRALCDGVFGFSAPHPTDPLRVRGCQAISRLFEGRPKVLITTWRSLEGERTPALRHDRIFAHFAEKFGFVADDIFVFDDGGSCLSAAQLDRLQALGFPPVFINLRGWGPNGSREREADRLAAMAHPWCKGICIEGRPEALVRPILRLNHRLQIAQHVARLGKPLFFLNPPSDPDSCARCAPRSHNHIAKLEAMLRSLHSTLDGLTRPGQVTIVASAYDVRDKNLDFLPERDPDGGIANTFTGGLLFLAAHKGH